jgi:TPP-dependent trihydroxycyclohexane-1,2-dione (THcHDO) dehydratase
VIQQSGDGSFVMHAIGLGSAIGIHAVIAISVLRNRQNLA